ncbi:hypothetical protein [Simkania sp.]|uniref:hypothetical protein n=1 Tax=Simkania sp. TaxID=34094 RepID=UPI003B52713D
MSTTGIFSQTLNFNLHGDSEKGITAIDGVAYAHFYEASSKLSMAQEQSQSLTSNPPATIKTLEIDGVSVIEYQGMAFPTGHVVPLGQPEDIGNYTPSEAFGYAMRNAVAYDDEAFFQELLNGYLYLCNQTTLYREQMGLSGDMIGFGLIGWSPNIAGIPAEKGPYDGLDTSFVSSASDADEDIIGAMILAYQKWPDLVASDPLSAGQGTVSSISLNQLIDQAIDSFVRNDLGDYQVTLNGETHSYYAMSLDNWQHDPVYPDYFDPLEFTEMIQWVGAESPNGQALIRAAQGTMQLVIDVQKANGGWMSDTPFYLGGPNSFGYDAVRMLMRFGEYLLYTEKTGNDLLGIKDQVAASLSTLVERIFSHDGQYLSWGDWDDGTLTFNPSGLGYGQFTGPLLVALVGLEQYGALPDDVSQDDIEKVAHYFQNDLTHYSVDSMGDYQQNYFAIQLALLSEGILKEYAQN